MARKQNMVRRSKHKCDTINTDLPDVYQEMLAEVMSLQHDCSSRPLKQRILEPKTSTNDMGNVISYKSTKEKEKIGSNKGEINESGKAGSKSIDIHQAQIENYNDMYLEDVLFENKKLSKSSSEFNDRSNPVINSQNILKEIDEDSEISDCDWENVELEIHSDVEGKALSGNSKIGDLELTLNKNLATQLKSANYKKKSFRKDDRLLRLAIHKTHILCLLTSLDRRNDWCNDPEVHDSLKTFIPQKILNMLKPKSHLSQFGRTESLKKGLHEISIVWKTQFCITKRGIRRALWADEIKNLPNFKLSYDYDSVVDIIDFRKAAASVKLQGSRDVGTQLFCALLRSIGIEARLICSLQPLSFKSGGPIRTSKPLTCSDDEDKSHYLSTEIVETPNLQLHNSKDFSNQSDLLLKQRQRLGHPNAADYHMPKVKSPPQSFQETVRAKHIRESPYPIFWVEVFDEAHQKWISVDPLVTQTVGKNRVFEPPASDKENNMSYVIACNREGHMRDVTRRYAKAYNSKTRKMRVESTGGGEKWWSKIMNFFSLSWHSDADQIEDIELANLEAKEPMPKSIIDFKGHPYFVLKRNLRRNEVLVRAQECGRIATGRDMGTNVGKKMESVYRRQDVQVAKSMNFWYRSGRVVKIGEQPVKVIESGNTQIDKLGEEITNSKISLFLEEQTDLYQPPPVLNGIVPKNSFGNIELFVPSMLPQGAAYLPHNEANRAAQILEIDYANALTGFKFQGRHGTAILRGIVVSKECEEATKLVIEELKNEQDEAEGILRSQVALRMWKRLTIALRIKKRIDTYKNEIEFEDNNQEAHEKSRDSYHLHNKHHMVK